VTSDRQLLVNILKAYRQYHDIDVLVFYTDQKFGMKNKEERRNERLLHKEIYIEI